IGQQSARDDQWRRIITVDAHHVIARTTVDGIARCEFRAHVEDVIATPATQRVVAALAKVELICECAAGLTLIARSAEIYKAVNLDHAVGELGILDTGQGIGAIWTGNRDGLVGIQRRADGVLVLGAAEYGDVCAIAAIDRVVAQAAYE